MAKRRREEMGKLQQEQRLRKSESCVSGNNVKHQHSDEPYAYDTDMREDSSRENEDDWLMQTLYGCNYELQYEHDTCIHSWEHNTQTQKEESNILEGTKLTEGIVEEGKLSDTKTQTREERIKSLKALLCKHKEDIEKLWPDANNDKQKKCSVIARNRKMIATRSNVFTEAKDYSIKRRICRRKRKRAEPRTSGVVNTRDVDILMSKGNLMTKDEFLAVLGLVRVTKLYSL